MSKLVLSARPPVRVLDYSAVKLGRAESDGEPRDCTACFHLYPLQTATVPQCPVSQASDIHSAMCTAAAGLSVEKLYQNEARFRIDFNRFLLQPRLRPTPMGTFEILFGDNFKSFFFFFLCHRCVFCSCSR